MTRRWGREDQNTMIEALEHQGGEMTLWEEKFVESIRAWFNAGRELSTEQLRTLERIYRERTS